MKQGTGRLVEVWLEGQELAGRLDCPPELAPAPGQYLLASPLARPGGWVEPLAMPLFAAGGPPVSLRLAPPLPLNWQPGLELALRGPCGRGFQLPPYTRRLALVAVDAAPACLLPLAAKTLSGGGEVTLFCDPAGRSLALEAFPAEVEVAGLEEFPTALAWADAMAFDLPAVALPGLRARIGLQAGDAILCPVQALVLTPMPCAGLADCGACAIPLHSHPAGRGASRRTRGGPHGWALACKDGPVFDLEALEW